MNRCEKCNYFGFSPKDKEPRCYKDTPCVENPKRPTIYAIDFDGTIVENEFPKIGKIKGDALLFIRFLQDRGDKWILYTMREGDLLNEALEFLAEWNLIPDAINDNLPEMKDFYGNNPRKVFANVYIDDHNAGGLYFGVPYIDR